LRRGCGPLKNEVVAIEEGGPGGMASALRYLGEPCPETSKPPDVLK